MRHAERHGFPSPRVLEITTDGLVLERIDGPTMGAALRGHPWTLRRNASLLAELHTRLHRIVAPAPLPEVGAGDRLLHLDLHPENVILFACGPCGHRLGERGTWRSIGRRGSHLGHSGDQRRAPRPMVPP